MRNRSGTWDALLGLLFPKQRTCPLCQQPFVRQEEVVCTPCTMLVRAGRPPFCRLCGRELAAAGVCADCKRRGEERFFLRAFSYGPYEGRLRDLLLRLKRDGQADVLPLLSDCLAEAWAAHLFSSGIDCLVPVPTTAAKLRQRGFNQAERLARGLSAAAGVPVRDVLRWQDDRDGRSQAARNREQRLVSMERSLGLSQQAQDVAGCTVCLVDDVYTTGATANACAKQLLEAGARTVYVLTVAR